MKSAPFFVTGTAIISLVLAAGCVPSAISKRPVPLAAAAEKPGQPPDQRTEEIAAQITGGLFGLDRIRSYEDLAQMIYIPSPTKPIISNTKDGLRLSLNLMVSRMPLELTAVIDGDEDLTNVRAEIPVALVLPKGGDKDRKGNEKEKTAAERVRRLSWICQSADCMNSLIEIDFRTAEGIDLTSALLIRGAKYKLLWSANETNDVAEADASQANEGETKKCASVLSNLQASSRIDEFVVYTSKTAYIIHRFNGTSVSADEATAKANDEHSSELVFSTEASDLSSMESSIFTSMQPEDNFALSNVSEALRPCIARVRVGADKSVTVDTVMSATENSAPVLHGRLTPIQE